MLKILITAFKPFGDIEDNSSLRVIEKINNSGNAIIIKCILDVVYDRLIFEDLLIKYQPDILLLCGQAAGRDKVTLEQIGINFIHSTQSDNDGLVISNEKILIDGEDAYFNTVNSANIVRLLEKTHPVKLSLSAGGYVCNYGFYTALHYAKKNQLNTNIGFIHFPLFSGQTSKNYPSLDLNIMVDTMNKIIDLLIKEKTCKV
ncbi:MAG: pyroglutamyl-peptidase I [Bacilli bacterium]